MRNYARGITLAATAVIAFSFLLSGFSSVLLSNAQSTATTITVYKSQVPVTLSGTYVPSQWSDTPLATESFSGITYGFKQNGTGLLFLLAWPYNSGFCTDQYCFGGIELGNLNNTGQMGTGDTPTIMILISPSFTKGYDEFTSSSDTIPVSVETQGYQTQTTCATSLTGSTWLAICYRPFQLANPFPHDPFIAFATGSPIEIGFAVGEFNVPGEHYATDMSSYELATSSQTTTITTPQEISTATSTNSSNNTTATGNSTTTSVTGVTSTNNATTSQSKPATSNLPLYYEEELSVLVVGFGALTFVILRPYNRRA